MKVTSELYYRELYNFTILQQNENIKLRGASSQKEGIWRVDSTFVSECIIFWGGFTCLNCLWNIMCITSRYSKTDLKIIKIKKDISRAC